MVNIGKKISEVAAVTLPHITEIELYNGYRVDGFFRRQQERQMLGAYQYELAQQPDYANLVRSLWSYKKNVGLACSGTLRFMGSPDVHRELVARCGYIGAVYKANCGAVIPQIISMWMSNVVPEVKQRMAACIQLFRGLLTHRLMQIMLRRRTAKNWLEVKGTIKRIAADLDVDIYPQLNRQNLRAFVKSISDNLDADISICIRVLMVLIDNEPKKLASLAALVARFVMGHGFTVQLRPVKSSVGVIANNADFLTSFLSGLLSFGVAEGFENPAVIYNNANRNWVVDPTAYNYRFYGVDPNAKLGPIVSLISTLTVADLSMTSAVSKVLEAEVAGACVNICEMSNVPPSASKSLFKDIVTGRTVTNDDCIFGHQEIKADMEFAFVAQSDGEISKLTDNDITCDICKLSTDVPLDIEISQSFSTQSKILMLAFLLMLGTEELASENSDVDVVASQSITEQFISDCCTLVTVRANEKISDENAVGVKTLEAALCLYSQNPKLKLSKEFLKRRGFRIAENSKSAAIFDHYNKLGYTEEELLKPRSGGNHAVGLTLKSRAAVIEAGELKRKINNQTQLSDRDFVRFFYERFEDLLAKYCKIFH